MVELSAPATPGPRDDTDQVLAEPRKRFTGSFVDRKLESEFRSAQWSLENRRFVRASIVVSSLCFLFYALHDRLVIPSVVSQAWAFRFGFFVPFALLCITLTFSRWGESLHQTVGVLFGTTATVTVVAIGAISPTDSYYAYTSYAVLFVTIGPFLLRLEVFSQMVYVVVSVLVFNFANWFLRANPLHVYISMNFSLMSMGGLGGFIAYMRGRDARNGFLQRRLIHRQYALLDAESAKAEKLLLNILPQPIAERLKADSRSIADGFAEVTVLFSDIVGFTKMSARLSPDEVVSRLNEMFSAFDDIASHLGLEKIKTIGDAYMVAAGLPEPRADHAEAIAEMALRMQEAVAEFSKRRGEPLTVRVGIHTGPVVAGVIGKQKFIYDVWGDTVNTASRMESHGEPGQIHVSDTTYKRLAERFTFKSRGAIEVKGKGLMETYFLLDRLKPPM